MTRENSRCLRLLHVAPLAPPVTGIGVSFQHFLASSPLAAHTNWVINSAGQPARSSGTKRPTPRRILRHVWLTARVMRAARAKRVDVVHLHGSSHDLSFVANGVSVAAAGLTGAHTVWHLHEDLSVVQFPGRSALTRATFASLTRAPSTLALLTEKDGMIARGFVPEHKLVIIPPTCSPEMLSVPLVRSNGSSFRVLFVGWLSEAKGIFDLLRVAHLARDRIAGLEFWVVGIARSDDEARSVKACIDQRNLHSVVNLRGLVTGAAKLRLFADAHLLFLPTHWDAFPVTVLEAMSAGLPVVGTRVGGLPRMVEDGRGARLAPVGDVDRLVEHLVELASDADRRVQMGNANRQRFVDHYHPDHVGQLAVDVYRRLASR